MNPVDQATILADKLVCPTCGETEALESVDVVIAYQTIEIRRIKGHAGLRTLGWGASEAAWQTAVTTGYRCATCKTKVDRARADLLDFILGTKRDDSRYPF